MNNKNQLWQRMLSRSFSPQQWFVSDDRPGPLEDDPTILGESKMYVYRRTEQGMYTVGFYDPRGEWHPESDHPTPEAAATRVRWLHGG